MARAELAGLKESPTFRTPNTEHIYVFDAYNTRNGLVVRHMLDISPYVGENGYLRRTKHKLTDQVDMALQCVMLDYLSMRRAVDLDIHGRGVFLVSSKIELTLAELMTIINTLPAEARETILKDGQLCAKN